MSNDCICHLTKASVTRDCARKFCDNTFIETVEGKGRIAMMLCPQHKASMICGPVLQVCQECANQGYRVLSGYGGPTKWFKDDQEIQNQ